MEVLRQSATNDVTLELGLDMEQYPKFVIRFFQNGREILRKYSEDCVVESGRVQLSLRADEAALFSPQRFAVEIAVTSADGSVTLVSDEITGLVARSKGG